MDNDIYLHKLDIRIFMFGVVYRCFSAATGESFACKSIDKHALSEDTTNRECLKKEPKILQLLSGCPSIVRLYRFYEDDDSLHMVTDLCNGGNMFDRMSSGTSFSEDIKPDNILFDSQGRLKLADFGSADWFGVSEDGTMRGVLGTPYYVAPEVLMGGEYNEKVDVWSAGVILYIMLAGAPPFYGDSPVEIFESVLRGSLRFPLTIFRSVSSEAKDLLRKMICRDVLRQFSADQVLRNPWIINVREAQVNG
ncbi:Phosphoenolpyruvate carboxylase kinase 2 [Forsythia ovata]|uniref:Phosphoenolpyruvate carboxylase kinase 2 n=1 Tax=Forsythia ovata TaxID=205694 RepID=A0ABD1X7W6_9LAMI